MINDDNTISMISKQAILNMLDREVKDTSPSLYDKEDKFMEFMDNKSISDFGRWQFANGYNAALTSIQAYVKSMKSIDVEVYLKSLDVDIFTENNNWGNYI